MARALLHPAAMPVWALVILAAAYWCRFDAPIWMALA